MLLTVLGEFALPTNQPVWTASLLYILTGLGISEQTARQAVTRAADAGWIVGEKVGREVRWSVTSTATSIIEETTHRALSLNSGTEHWDGKCLILHVTISEQKRVVRKRLYSELGWAGFGNPAPGLWASPHVDRLEGTKKLIHELGLQDSTIAFIGSPTEVGLTDQEIIGRAWDLQDIAVRYEQLLTTYEKLDPGTGDDVAFAFVSLVTEWRQFPYLDPQLPRDLLPDWIGRRAAEVYYTLSTTWASAARARWTEIVRETSP